MIAPTTATAAFFARTAQGLATLRQGTDALQQQLTSGERLASAADDPLAAAQLRQLARAETLRGADAAVANRASADLGLADAALQSLADLTSEAHTLATQAANATLSDSQRGAIGAQLAQLDDQLFQLANSQDSSGHALFGGTASGAAYVRDAAGHAVYAGTAAAPPVALGEGQSVPGGITGPEFLDFSVNGQSANLLATISTLAQTLQGNGGGAAGAAAAHAALDPLSAGLGAIATAQATVGARAAWIDLTTQHRQAASDQAASLTASLGGVDVASTVARLQQSMLVLEASQASFARLSGLSLFDRLG